MSLFHAVAQIDHQHALIVQFDADHTEVRKLKASGHQTHKRGSNVRTEHEFFGEVCDALAGIKEVLVVGPNTAQADFRHYVTKHRAALAGQIAGWETADHPTEAQLVAQGRKFFAGHDRMAGTPTPG